MVFSTDEYCTDFTISNWKKSLTSFKATRLGRGQKRCKKLKCRNVAWSDNVAGWGKNYKVPQCFYWYPSPKIETPNRFIWWKTFCINHWVSLPLCQSFRTFARHTHCSRISPFEMKWFKRLLEKAKDKRLKPKPSSPPWWVPRNLR